MVTHKQFSVGDGVSFTLGTTSIHGVVVDERGPIGANNVHIYRVRIPNDPYDDDVIEMPEDELAFADKTVESIPNSSVLDYLKHGGLVQILKANAAGGRNQPRVWLTRDRIGNPVHTFTAERGIVGGATIPFFALHDNHVFAAKFNEVLCFLTTFGLSDDDARCVIDAIGIAP